MRRKTFKIAGYILGAVLFHATLCGAASQGELVSIPERPSGYVNDYAGLIQPGEEAAINAFAAELNKKTTAQVAVVTVGTTSPETAHSFSVRLFDKWKIGQKGKDNGVLILVAVNDRQAWITTGYGMEGAIPDAVANKIVRDVMAPSFKKGKYSEGILNGSVAVISLMAKEYGVKVTGKEESTHKALAREKSGLEILLTIILFIVIIGMRSGFLGYFLLGSMVGGRRRGGYWYGTGGGSSRGSFGGGFGGFGGGMCGGGGGGGGW